MKKLIAILLMSVLVLGVFSGCSGEADRKTASIASTDNSSSDSDDYTYSSSYVSSAGSTSSGGTTSNSSSQATFNYNLPTIDEFVSNFKNYFTMTGLEYRSNAVMFETYGDTVFGFTNSDNKVYKCMSSASGSSINALLETQYHYYPICHYVTQVTGKTVTAVEILEALNSGKWSSGSYSKTLSAKVDGILYELTLTETSFGAQKYCRMDLSAEID